MTYENMTYDKILSRMLQRISDKNSNLDTREGSMLFNAVAPEAMELAITYIELDNLRNETYIETASRYGKTQRCKEVGINTSIFEAKYGKFKGEFNIQVELGSRWNLDLYNYAVTSYIGKNASNNHEYILTCDTIGTAPNNVFGTLTPVLYNPAGLEIAELTETIVEGENEASEEFMIESYFSHVNGSVSDGNLKQYEVWCDEYDGVGKYKLLPLWNGPNTLKISILSGSNDIASDELIAEFQSYLDPNSSGMGDGKAPIGAIITVTTAIKKLINLTCNITLAAGYTDTTLIDKALTEYFSEIAYDKAQISYMRVGAVILDCPCVDIISDLLINGGTDDLTLVNEEIPYLGTTAWTVVTP